MNSTKKMAVVDTILTRTAEKIGDITAPVMSAYFDRLPEARDLFKHHGLNNMENLEGQMVEQALYCLMYWFESPGEIEILLLGSVPHHNDTLNVPPRVYSELLNATADIVEGTIPRTNADEIAVWRELRDDLSKLILESSKYIH